MKTLLVLVIMLANFSCKPTIKMPYCAPSPEYTYVTLMDLSNLSYGDLEYEILANKIGLLFNLVQQEIISFDLFLEVFFEINLHLTEGVICVETLNIIDYFIYPNGLYSDCDTIYSIIEKNNQRIKDKMTSIWRN